VVSLLLPRLQNSLKWFILEQTAMGANTRYKDSVFSFLFNNPDILRN
jgi:hypothetical protein